MVTAYVMVKALKGDADQIRDEIAAIDGVENVHIVAGDVDFIAKVAVDTPAQVKAIAVDVIHDIDGVDTTQTYIAMD